MFYVSLKNNGKLITLFLRNDIYQFNSQIESELSDEKNFWLFSIRFIL
jgi:hypothetical protein